MPIKFLVFIALISAVLSNAMADEILYLQPGALDYIGVYELRTYDPNLTGKGVTIGTICRSLTYEDGEPSNDFAVNTAHHCFKNSDISHFSQYGPDVRYSDHATAIASILVGDSQAGFYPELGEFYYEGVCPEAKLNIYEFWHFVQEYIFNKKTLDVDILSISSGTTYQQWWTRGIECLANQGITIVAGIGNGTKASDPILYPGGSANVIGVGVVDCVIDENIAVTLVNYALPKSEHSSMGPAGNRSKPDIVAPGNCIVADTNDGYFISENYSSFATPIVAGSAALLTQKINEKYSDKVPSNSRSILVKSLLMSSADKLAYWHKGLPDSSDDHETALDYLQGAGLINIISAFDLLIGYEANISGWKCSVLENDEILSIPTFTESDIAKFTATLTWNYQYEEDYPFNSISTPNLRLELWATDVNDPSIETLIDYSDCKAGTVEHIYSKIDTNFEKFTIKIKHSKPHDNESVDFALSWRFENQENKFDPILFYDLNNDGVVNHADFLILINNMGKPSQSSKKVIYGDINFNGKIDAADLSAIMEQQGLKADWK